MNSHTRSRRSYGLFPLLVLLAALLLAACDSQSPPNTPAGPTLSPAEKFLQGTYERVAAGQVERWTFDKGRFTHDLPDGTRETGQFAITAQTETSATLHLSGITGGTGGAERDLTVTYNPTQHTIDVGDGKGPFGRPNSD